MTTEDPNRPTSHAAGTRHRAADYVLTFAGVVAFMLTIAAVGLVVELLAGIGGLAIVAGVFVVVLMCAMRHEGVL